MTTRPTTAPTPAADAATIEVVANLGHAVASETRLRLLMRLARSAATVTELMTDVEMEQSAVSHQLQVLRRLGLVGATRDGQHVVYSLANRHVAEFLVAAIAHAEHVRFGDDVPDTARE